MLSHSLEADAPKPPPKGDDAGAPKGFAAGVLAAPNAGAGEKLPNGELAEEGAPKPPAEGAGAAVEFFTPAW